MALKLTSNRDFVGEDVGMGLASDTIVGIPSRDIWDIFPSF